MLSCDGNDKDTDKDVVVDTDTDADTSDTSTVSCADLFFDSTCVKDPACLPDYPDETAAGTLPETIIGETVGNADEIQPSCIPSDVIADYKSYKKNYPKYYPKGTLEGLGAGDYQVEYTAPQSGDYVIDLAGSSYDTALAVFDGCGGKEIACNDDWLGERSQVVVNLTKGDTIVIDVDGNFEGDFTLNVAEIQTNETVCDDGRDLDNDGDVDCQDADCAKDAACKGYKKKYP